MESFFEKAFEQNQISQQFEDPLHALICEEHLEICKAFDISKIQESWSWRNVFISRNLALQLISENGDIHRKKLLKTIQWLKESLYSLGPGRHQDDARQRHLLKILTLFAENPLYGRALKQIIKPSGNSFIDTLIRETLLVPETMPLNDGHARQAAFSALLTYLRQNVGSCFATAPAILIQQQQPLQFLTDIAQLFGTGRLIRIQEGVEYTVPLSLSWGMGDLLKPIPLSSLGVDPFDTLAISPGLQAVLEKIGWIDLNSPQSEKIKQCATLIKKSTYFKDSAEQILAVFNCHQLIKSILLHKFKITEEDVEQFKLRTIQGPLADVVIQTHQIQKGKNLACSRFLKAFDEARNAFKAMTDNALLKAWEFTLASLSESKADFAKWNLYTSLGVNPEDPYGIGQSLHIAIQEKISKINEEMESFQANYDHLFAQAKYLEGRINAAATEREMGWIQAEYQIRRHEINRVLSERDEGYEKGIKLQKLYSHLIKFYGGKIRDYFQEVYDAEMIDISTSPYDDSPAGFRLLYKYGRRQTSLWTMIRSPIEYIQHLTSFFISTETELLQLPECDGIQKEVSELITTAITTIKRPEFLESSIIRLAKAYGEPLMPQFMEHLDQVKRKPWAYVSGGTMRTLMKYYWGAVNEPQEKKRWIETENEYLAFLIDTIKEFPFSVQREIQENPDQGILSFSPTHAFICKPGWSLFRQGWESDLYTYTWIKEEWLNPQRHFLDQCLLDSRMMELIIQQLLKSMPQTYRTIASQALSDFAIPLTPMEFYERVRGILSYEKWLQERGAFQWLSDELAAILFQTLPLFPEYQLRERLTLLFETISEIDEPLRHTLIEQIDAVEEAIGRYQILTAKDLKEIAMSLLINVLKKTRAAVPYYQKVTDAMQKQGLSYPKPFLFADTNWVNHVFGFTLNPGTASLELWRFDDSGSMGHPITTWKKYLNGTEKKEWGFYTNPHQYQFG